MRIWIWGVLYLGNVCNTEPVDVKSRSNDKVNSTLSK